MSQRKAYRARGNSPAVEYLPTAPNNNHRSRLHVEVGRSLYPGNCLSSLLGHFILVISAMPPFQPPPSTDGSGVEGALCRK